MCPASLQTHTQLNLSHEDTNTALLNHAQTASCVSNKILVSKFQSRELQPQLFIHMLAQMDPNGIIQLPLSKCQFEAFLVASFDLGLGTLFLEVVFGEYPWEPWHSQLFLKSHGMCLEHGIHTLPYISFHCGASHCITYAHTCYINLHLFESTKQYRYKIEQLVSF